MKKYWKYTITIICTLFVYGYLLPLLVSYPDSLLVGIGLFIGVLITPTVLYYVCKKDIVNLFKIIKEKI